MGTPSWGVKCSGYAEIAILSLYLASLPAVNAATSQVLSTRRRRTMVPQVVTLIAGSKRRSLFIAGDDDDMFMTRSLNVTPEDNRTAFNCTQ